MFTIRRARLSDCAILLEWRNDPATREMSISDGVVQYGEHAEWLDRSLRNPSRLLYIAEYDGAPIATTRFDIEGTTAEISITVAPGARRRGHAAPILAASIEKASKERPEIEAIVARIKAANLPSRRCFESLGFVQDDPAPGELCLYRRGIR